MREGNFSFTSQGRASVCITAQLYDRRALDTVSTLPLQNSLTHLTYLTSTSPRIRDILTTDGGLEALVRMLRDFIASPPPPNDPRQFYGLLPPSASQPRIPIVIPPPGQAFRPWDRSAAYRFSLALQSVVNVGVRGNEKIRTRVVEAGMLDMVGTLLETWLVHKGFATGPSATATGAPKESRSARQARKIEKAKEKEATDAQLLMQRLQREADEQSRKQVQGSSHTGPSSSTLPLSVMAERYNVRPALEPARLVARSPLDDEFTGDEAGPSVVMMDLDVVPPASSTDSLPVRPASSASGSLSADTSSATTPIRSSTPVSTIFVESRERSGTVVPTQSASSSHGAGPSSASSNEARSSSEPRNRSLGPSDVEFDEAELEEGEAGDSLLGISRDDVLETHSSRPRTIAVIENADTSIDMFGGNVAAFDMGVGAVDELVNIEPNDDLAMGAPPGAPGATTATPGPADHVPLPESTGPMTMEETPRARVVSLERPSGVGTAALTPIRPEGNVTAAMLHNEGQAQRTRVGITPTLIDVNAPAGPRIDPRHPRRAPVEIRTHVPQVGPRLSPYRDDDILLSLQLLAYLSKYPHLRQAFYEPRPALQPTTSSGPTAKPASSSPPTNLFSIVERFTFRPSPGEPTLPVLHPEIQKWAGVIMRNACRKDEARGGIRQCASMTCGKWETVPREFAKCRRCRKAKYCGKECQSRAWSEGHRFWCSSRDEGEGGRSEGVAGSTEDTTGETDAAAAAATRRHHHHHHHHHHPHRHVGGTVVPSTTAAPNENTRTAALAPNPGNRNEQLVAAARHHAAALYHAEMARTLRAGPPGATPSAGTERASPSPHVGLYRNNIGQHGRPIARLPGATRPSNSNAMDLDSVSVVSNTSSNSTVTGPSTAAPPTTLPYSFGASIQPASPSTTANTTLPNAAQVNSTPTGFQFVTWASAQRHTLFAAPLNALDIGRAATSNSARPTSNPLHSSDDISID